jgi:hypothetical protein
VTDLFILSQLAMLLFAAFSAIEEAAFTFPFREVTFDEKTKFKKLGEAHSAGALGVIAILAMIFFTQRIISQSFIQGLLAALSCGLIYWLVFDILYSFKIKKGLFYVGDTAWLDKTLKRIFGHKAGFFKALFCLVAIITINLIFKTV